MEYIVLIIAVIGFIANALKSAKKPASLESQAQIEARRIAQANAQRQAARPAQPGGSLAGAPKTTAPNKAPSGASQPGRIVSQAPMSSVAQQFAQQRAVSDRQMAAAAEQARAEDSVPAGTTDLPSGSQFVNSSAPAMQTNLTGSIKRNLLGVQRDEYLLNGFIFAQVLTPPLCKNARKSMQAVPASSQKP